MAAETEPICSWLQVPLSASGAAAVSSHEKVPLFAAFFTSCCVWSALTSDAEPGGRIPAAAKPSTRHRQSQNRCPA